jgi:protein HIRA/HIR1
LLEEGNSGRFNFRLLPVIFLGSSITFLECKKEFMMYITCTGTVSVWNVEKEQNILESCVGHLLKPGLSDDSFKATSVNIVSASLLEDGIPKVMTSHEDMYTYHFGLKTWMRVSDAKSAKYQMGKGISDSLISMGKGKTGLLSLSDIENHLACSMYLKMPQEYRYWLKLYCRRLSDENAVGKIEELCQDLLGPSHL